MAVVTLPYTFSSPDVQSEVWVYNFTIGSLSYTNTATVDTDITTTINSLRGTTASITVLSVTTITRVGTDPGSFTYIAAPSLKFTAGGVDFTYYSTSGSVGVLGNETQSITFSTTFDIQIPGSFIGKEWTATHFVQVDETNTARVDTGTLTSAGFLIPGGIDALFFGTNF